MVAKGRLIVLSAPAGTGKTTLVDRLKREFPSKVAQSISCTTRPPRKGEVNGEDYIFLSKEAFEERSRRGEFLEEVALFGSRYGTLKETVSRLQEEGKVVILVIDTQGALRLKREEGVEAFYLFMAPPSLEVLKKRLKRRRSESEESLEERLRWARYEMELSKEYDQVLVNDDLETTYNKLKEIITHLGESRWDMMN